MKIVCKDCKHVLIMKDDPSISQCPDCGSNNINIEIIDHVKRIKQERDNRSYNLLFILFALFPGIILVVIILWFLTNA